MQETREKYEKIIENNKKRLLTKIENNDERIKKQKHEQEQESLKKFNKLYMMREDRKIRVVQNDKIQKFERRQKMEQINARMERIEEMKRERYLLEEERRKMENEMNNKKDVMMGRLRKVMKSDEYFTREEIIDYVFNDVKPSHKTIKSQSKYIENENNNDDKKEDESNKENENNKEKENNKENENKEKADKSENIGQNDNEKKEDN